MSGAVKHSSKVLVLSLILGGCAFQASATIGYRISLDQPDKHLFRVTMTIPDVHDRVVVQMPAWNATYMIRDFASRIQDLSATSDGRVLAIEKLDKQTWRIFGNGKVTVTYAIYWDESSPFSSQLNSTHAFLNLAEVLVYLPDRRNEDVDLGIDGTPWNWNVVSSLKAAMLIVAGGIKVYDFKAPNYNSMVDSPIEVGQFQYFDLPGITPPVHVAVHGDKWNKDELIDGLSRVVHYETQLMGGAPYSDYTFIFHIGLNSGGGGGGMEHSNSTAIGANSVAGAISTAAHEFFHAWNVRRIRPQSLEPVDFTKEMYTRALWFAEGVTSTYASYTEVRTGLWTPQSFYNDLAVQIAELQSRPARKWQSVEESSLDAWFEKYRQYEQPEFSISYYNKGQLDGFFLDILIRDATDNKKSLDDVLRSMNENFAKKGLFYNDSVDIEATVESVAGVSFHDFFARYVAGTDDIPYAEFLAKAGLSLSVIPSTQPGREYRVSESNDATEKQRHIRDGLLKGTTN
jgi:predicted metalloprotease with PDZ domain